MNELISDLVQPGHTKIVLLVIDGLGGLRTSQGGSELFEADIPNLDRLAAEGSSGVHTVVAPGVTPGSGSGHLALFGYDPIEYQLGRGALCAAGIGFDLGPLDIAARLNFCSVDDAGLVVDRRAGRITTETNQRLCDLLTNKVDLGEGVQVIVEPERDYRALFVLRAEGLSPHVSDTDPQRAGLAPRKLMALSMEAQLTESLLKEFLRQARDLLREEAANYVLLRGFDTLRNLPRFPTLCRMRALGIACYPMYIGVARILGMEVASAKSNLEEEISELEASWAKYDFFYVHHKNTDSAGEDGDFARKCSELELVDKIIPRLMELNPDVVCVTGDHATPTYLRGHSWHPVPFLQWGPMVGMDSATQFNEEQARHGSFGHILAKDLMPLMLAGAGRLEKFGA